MRIVSKNNIFLFGIILLISLLTLLRENVFLELNSVIEGLDYNQAYFYWLDDVFRDIQEPRLVQIKWILTAFFILVIYLLTIAGINIWFQNSNFLRIINKVYFVLFGLILLLGIIYWYTGFYEIYYFLVRRIIAVLNSPIPLFFFFSVFFYLSKQQNYSQ